jgi:hypothetical protein
MKCIISIYVYVFLKIDIYYYSTLKDLSLKDSTPRFCGSQTFLSLKNYIKENINIYNIKNKYIMKVYSMINLIVLIWYYQIFFF